MEQTSKVKGVVDIVFLIDATGSMSHCIDALKENISKFIDSLTGSDPNNTMPVKHWRGKVVGYRDYLCDKVPLVDNLFVEDATSLKSQLSALQAEGGGDEPESLLDGLYKVATQEQMEKGEQDLDPRKWRYRSDAARVVVAFTDASYHPNMTVCSGTVDDVISALHANRIILSLYAPEMDCHHEIARANRSEFFGIPYDTADSTGPQTALKAFTSDQANFRKTMEMLAKSVSQSAGVSLD